MVENITIFHFLLMDSQSWNYCWWCLEVETNLREDFKIKEKALLGASPCQPPNFTSTTVFTNDPGLPDSPNRSDLARGASGCGCIKCQSGVCHLDKDQSLTVDSWSFVCSSRCTAALVVLLSVC